MDKKFIKENAMHCDECGCTMVPTSSISPIEYLPDPVFDISTGKRVKIDTPYTLHLFKDLTDENYINMVPQSDLDLYIRRNALLNNFTLRVKFVIDNIYTTLSVGFKEYMTSIVTNGRELYGCDMFMSSSHNFLYQLEVVSLLTSANALDIATTMTFEVYNAMMANLGRYMSRNMVKVSFEEASEKILQLAVEFRTEIARSIVLLNAEAEIYKLNGVPNMAPEICNVKGIKDLTKPYNRVGVFSYDDEF